MEPAGLAFGVVGLAAVLAKATKDCYIICSEMSEFGNAHDSLTHSLRTEGLRLKQWEEHWGFGVAHGQRLDPNDHKYRYAVATLARIVALFSNLDKLQSKYGLVQDGDQNISRIQHSASPTPSLQSSATVNGRLKGKGKEVTVRVKDWGHRLSVSWSPSKSSQQQLPAPNAHSGRNTPNQNPPVNTNDLNQLENPRFLANHDILPGLTEEIVSVHEAADRIQQSLSSYSKLKWAISDKTKFSAFVQQLKIYVDGLCSILPYQTGPVMLLQPPQAASEKCSKFKITSLSLEYPRNSHFTGRNSILDNIHEHMSKNKGTYKMIVLHGGGGMGKTQLALEYVYRHHKEYSSVFWVNATNEQTANLGYSTILKKIILHCVKSTPTQDYSTIGRDLGIPGQVSSEGKLKEDVTPQEIVSAVMNWFSDAENELWLLVLDNVDDLSFDISKFIPRSPHGALLATSRRPDFAQRGIGVNIREMQEDDAVSLLLASAGFGQALSVISEEDTEEAKAIVIDLGYWPLAVQQAGAYMAINQISLNAYRKKYNSELQTHILSNRWAQGEYDYSVFATLEISFNAIEQRNPNISELSLNCGLFENDDIWEGLLFDSDDLNDLQKKQSINILFSYSLARRNGKDDSFTLHPLVHSWLQHRLRSDSARLFDILARSLKRLHAIGALHHDPSNFDPQLREKFHALCRRLLPHLLALYREIQLQNFQTTDARLFSLLVPLKFLSDVLQHNTHYSEQYQLLRLVAASREFELGADSVSNDIFLTSVYKPLGWNSASRFFLSESITWYEKALSCMECIYGPDSKEQIEVLSHIGLSLHDLHKHKEAQEYLYKAFSIHEKAFGPDILDHLKGSLYLWLANTIISLGDFKEAMILLGKSLQIMEKCLGPDCLESTYIFQSMGDVCRLQGNNTNARNYYERGLSISERILGPHHPTISFSLMRLGDMYQLEGQLDKAISLYERCILIRERIFGRLNVMTTEPMLEKAKSIFSQGNHSKAYSLFEEVIQIRKEVLGSGVKTYQAIHAMARAMMKEDKNSRVALGYLENVKENYERTLGVDRYNTVVVCFDLALALHKLEEDIPRALELARHCRDFYESRIAQSEEYRHNFKLAEDLIVLLENYM
ncbi:hypothetical protein DFH27DRAFT_574567 [Peziza echinospora]|nr:hypothetical protein DFH27DRAFT_574567 [Peziza echinospora]